MSKPIEPDQHSPKCALCRKRPVSLDYRPFCSKRCADIDLGQWLKSGYAIPGAPIEDSGSTRAEEPPQDD